MYQPDPRKFTSKPDPKKEFHQYFKNSGAAAALENAITLLHRMPMKPDNLTDFFAEYFENGGKQMVQISVLKAELCYKQAELEKYNEKVKTSEARIEELLNQLGISEEEFNERFIPDKIKENNRLSILERYFKDLERGTASDNIDMFGDEGSISVSDNTKPRSTQDVFDNEGLECDPDNNCTVRPSSDEIVKDDLAIIKELDPWGIVCRTPYHHRGGSGKARDTNLLGSDKPSGDLIPQKSAQSLLNVTNEQNNKERESGMADDDGATLAEIFQQSIFDWMDLDPDEESTKLHSQLLTIKKPDKIQLGDWMGWGPLPTRGDQRKAKETDDEDDVSERPSFTNANQNAEEEEFMKDNFDENFSNIEHLKQKPCQEKIQEARKSFNEAKIEEASDAFLFDDDDDDDDQTENVFRLMELEAAYQGCILEMPQGERVSVPHSDGVELDPQCDCDCNAERTGTNALEDKMGDWNSQYQSYPSTANEGEDYIGLEAMSLISDANSARHISSAENLRNLQLACACECLLESSYSLKDMDPTTGKDNTEVSEKKAEDAGVRTGSVSEEPQQSKKRSSSVKTKDSKKSEDATEIDDEAEDNMPSDVFGVDLSKEVRRTVLGIRNSELSTSSGGSEKLKAERPPVRVTKHKKIPPSHLNTQRARGAKKK